MKKNKYLTILRSLSETELKDFSKFLSLRYHRSSVILDIHKYFKKNYLEWRSPGEQYPSPSDTDADLRTTGGPPPLDLWVFVF